MTNTETVKNDADNAHAATRPDLDGEELRYGAFYKPISVREYFKVLRYCLLGFIAIGIALTLFNLYSK